MRYSYAWDVTPTDLFVTEDGRSLHRWPDDTFVAMQGRVRWETPPHDGIQDLEACDLQGGAHIVQVRAAATTSSSGGDVDWQQVPTGFASNRHEVFVGRVECEEVVGIALYSGGSEVTEDVMVCVDTTASRFHGASITGLIVGVMGVAVFVMYLRTWLRERKACLPPHRQAAA
jgi:hypothetical protein